MQEKSDKNFILAILAVFVFILILVVGIAMHLGLNFKMQKEKTDIGLEISNFINRKKILACKNETTCTAINTPNGTLWVSDVQSQTYLNYTNAEKYCRKLGMRIPTNEEMWYLWINSTNCHRKFTLNEEIVASKEEFIKNCRTSPREIKYRKECMTLPQNVKYTCAGKNLTFSPKIDHDNSYEYYWTSIPYGSGNMAYVLDDGFSSALKKNEIETGAITRCVLSEK